MLGNNMFTYCLNNPVVLTDSSGAAAHIGFSADGKIHDAPWRIGSPGGGGWSQDIHYSQQDYGAVADKFITLSVLKYVFNTDEQVVLNAKYLAFYKCAPVIKIKALGGSGASFGLIFLGPNVDAQIVRHEYGHFVHLLIIGVDNYISHVAIPSLHDYWTNVPYDEYYSEPQEYIADILGGVNRTYYGTPYPYTITGIEAAKYFVNSWIY